MAYQELKERQSVDVGHRSLPAGDRDAHRLPRAGGDAAAPPGRACAGWTSPAAPARSPSGPPHARRERHRRRSGSGADRNREAARRRLRASPSTTASATASSSSSTDASFDAVSSTCGVMFAPDHAGDRGRAGPGHATGRAARAGQLDPRTGGWHDVQGDGPVQPAPPPRNPFDWGDETHVRELLGDAFELTSREHVSTAAACRRARRTGSCSPRATDPPRCWPTRSATAARNSTAPGSTCSKEHYRADGRIVHRREYLLVTGKRR